MRTLIACVVLLLAGTAWGGQSTIVRPAHVFAALSGPANRP